MTEEPESGIPIDVYQQLVDFEAETVAVLRKAETVLAVPRVGEGFVTAEHWDVPVTLVVHDTSASREHQITVFIEQQVSDEPGLVSADSVISSHLAEGWELVRDERPASRRTRKTWNEQVFAILRLDNIEAADAPDWQMVLDRLAIVKVHRDQDQANADAERLNDLQRARGVDCHYVVLATRLIHPE